MGELGDLVWNLLGGNCGSSKGPGNGYARVVRFGMAVSRVLGFLPGRGDLCYAIDAGGEFRVGVLGQVEFANSFQDAH